MTFSKSFPHTTEKSVYPKWEEILLSDDEELTQETLARKDNIKKMQECIDDAKRIIESKNLKPYQTDMINLAISLFEKRGSHEVYYKENKAKEKFDIKFK
jgi:hypothetical protein